MTIDVAAFVGPYPFRHLDHHAPEHLLAHMDRTGIDEAWVGHLPSFLYRDPAPGNTALRRLLDGQPRLKPVPTLHPDVPGWRADLAEAGECGAPSIRVYPQHHVVDPVGGAMRGLVGAAADVGMIVTLTVRFEDLRQRHPLDTAPDLPAAAVRALARLGDGVRLIVTHADRRFIEEVHYGLTEPEAERVLWDCSWIWGPPEDDLQHLMSTVGASRFVFGSGMPLRIPDATWAKLDLLDISSADRAAVLAENLARWR